MLDKSVPYKNIIMKLDAESIASVSDPVLPKGYTFKRYEEGDEMHWAQIEASVLEFSSKHEACDYFKRNYIPRRCELKERCIFVLDQNKSYIATATAWHESSDLGRQAELHWVAVSPEYQKTGIGEAIVKKALQIYRALGPHADIFLHTQTWSHTAVKLYHKLGFVMMKQGTIKGCGNDYFEAIKILKRVLPKEVYLSLTGTAQ